MNYFTKTKDEVLKELETSENGLSHEQAAERLTKYGENKLADAKKTPLIVKFLSQFKDVMVIVLLVAAMVSLVVSIVNGESSELVDACIIFGIVLLNAILGTIQESKAENALESLKKMSQPFAKVIRDGKIHKVKTTDIVPGDVVVLEAGDVVPADLYLIECASLKCEEASLTGESKPAEKQCDIALKEKTPLGDRVNMCFSSSTVVYGRGVGVVVATGSEAEMGKIANMLNETKADQTPLEKNLAKLGKILTIIVLSIAAVLFIVNVCIDSSKVIEAFLTAVAVAVAAIPESLPVVVTIILSLGVTKLAKKNVIIRKLHAVETLGCCEVICSDKTGTITQNKMTVRELYFNGNLVTAEDMELTTPEAVHLVNCMTLCNDSKKQGETYIGDPTETALVEFAETKAIVKSKLEKNMKRVGELPFDSERKLMSTANLTEKGVIKGFITDNNEILEPKYIYLRKNFVYYSKTKLLNRNIYPKKNVASLENIKVNILPFDNKNTDNFVPSKLQFNTDTILGKVAKDTLFGVNNEIIIKANQIISEKTIEDASRHNRLNQLYFIAN